MNHDSSLKWKGLFLTISCVHCLLQAGKGCVHVILTQRHIPMGPVFIQASSCKETRERELGNYTYVFRKRKHGNYHIHPLGSAILLKFYFPWPCCLSSNRHRNLIYVRELTFENCPNDTKNIF